MATVGRCLAQDLLSEPALQLYSIVLQLLLSDLGFSRTGLISLVDDVGEANANRTSNLLPIYAISLAGALPTD